MSVFIKFLPQHGRWFEKVFGQMWEGLIQPVRLRQWWLQECCSFIRNRYRTSPRREPCFLTGRPFQSRSMEICGVRGGCKFLVTGGRRRIRAGMLGLVCILIGYFMIYTTAYIIIVPDAADIVCGAKNFMWSNFAPHENLPCHVNQNCSSWE